MQLQYFFILVLVLGITAFDENDEQGAGTGETDQDCEPGTPGSDGYCKKEKEPDFEVDEDLDLNSAIDLTNLKFHAQTIKLREGSWCVSVSYNQQLGPRLLTLLWFQYGPKVAYSVLRNQVPLTEYYDFGTQDLAHVRLSVMAFQPFTMDAILVPGILNVAKEHITITRGFCIDEDDSIDLDGSRAHADRLLTCHMDSSEPRCRWNREKEDEEEEEEEEDDEEEEGATVAKWVCQSAAGDVEHEGDRFLDEDQAALFHQAWPLTEEEEKESEESKEPGVESVERRFLVSEWMKPRAVPGCLRLLFYAWGPPPQAVMVHVHLKGTPLTRAKNFALDLHLKYITTWIEELIPAEVDDDDDDEAGEYRLIVDFIGDRRWAGSLMLDDVSEEDQPCVSETAHILSTP